ncbi:MAG: tetratricopeptide repeat protein, partial [Muribaculaceae bacterium]|nr:tetratricopeptide repeat protein [Muribaculaceae bacterium]
NYVKGNYGEALAEVEKAIKFTPKKDKNWMSGNYISRAVINLELADTAAAVKDFETSLKLEPENEPAFSKYAELLYEMKDYDRSDEMFAKLIKLNPGNPYGYMGIGRNEKFRKNFDSAVEWFSKAIRLDENYSSGYSFRAEALLELGKVNEAIDDIVKALDIDADDKAFYLLTHLPSSEAQDIAKAKLKVMQTKQPANNYWPFALASLASSRNEYADAIPFYEKAYSLEAHPLFLKRIAKCLLETSNYDKALEYTDRYLEMEPADVSIFDMRAELFTYKGDVENALAERNKIIEAYPEEGFTYIERADLLMDLNRPTEAAEDYETAVALMPELSSLSYVHTKLGDAYRFSGKDAKARAS